MLVLPVALSIKIFRESFPALQQCSPKHKSVPGVSACAVIYTHGLATHYTARRVAQSKRMSAVETPSGTRRGSASGKCERSTVQTERRYSGHLPGQHTDYQSDLDADTGFVCGRNHQNATLIRVKETNNAVQ